MRVLHKLAPLAFIAVLILIIGTPAAIDAGQISLARGFLQMIAGTAFAAFLVMRGR